MIAFGVVNRHNPPKEQRAPYVESADAATSYRKTVKQLFEIPNTILTDEALDKTKLQGNLDLVIARRKKYYPDDA
jgi:hypothetical protein